MIVKVDGAAYIWDKARGLLYETNYEIMPKITAAAFKKIEAFTKDKEQCNKNDAL
jgi:hypothetical protein